MHNENYSDLKKRAERNKRLEDKWFHVLFIFERLREIKEGTYDILIPKYLEEVLHYDADSRMGSPTVLSMLQTNPAVRKVIVTPLVHKVEFRRYELVPPPRLP